MEKSQSLTVTKLRSNCGSHSSELYIYITYVDNLNFICKDNWT